ncbi:MAG: Hsp20/alpha crystallin family protein [Myxococcota bacterium]
MTQLDLLRPWGQEPLYFGALRREMDDLFERFGAFAPTLAARGAFPPVNLYETEDAYVLTAEVPGLAPEELEISLEGTTVTLRGERKTAPEEGASVHRNERPAGAFRRAFDLPVPIEADKAEAVHRHGVLTLRLPKALEHRPRQISVKAG